MPQPARSHAAPSPAPVLRQIIDHVNEYGWLYCLLVIVLFLSSTSGAAQRQSGADAASAAHMSRDAAR